jgi:hypothetical protein
LPLLPVPASLPGSGARHRAACCSNPEISLDISAQRCWLVEAALRQRHDPEVHP